MLHQDSIANSKHLSHFLRGLVDVAPLVSSVILCKTLGNPAHDNGDECISKMLLDFEIPIDLYRQRAVTV